MIAIVVSLLLLAATIANSILWRRALARESHWRFECNRQIKIGAAQYERLCTAQDNLAVAKRDADHLATCIREYVKQMDGYSMKLGETPCALSRERAALAHHESLSPCQNSLPSSTVSSSASPPTPTPPSPTSAES